MNNKGQVIFFGLMLCIVIIVMALALAPAIKETVDNARNSSSGDIQGMDCSNTSISDFDKAACTATDLTMFYFIGGLIFIGGAVLAAKILLQ